MQEVPQSQWVDEASTLTQILVYFGPWVLVTLLGVAIAWGVFRVIAYHRRLLAELERISSELKRIRGQGGFEPRP
jgi:hypothetical protein